MRFTTSKEQKQFFHEKGWLECEGLLQEGDCMELDSGELEAVVRVCKRRRLGELIFELTGARPLRVASVESQVRFPELPGEMWGLQIALTGEKRGNVTPFLRAGAEGLYFAKGACYLVVVLTSNYLDDARHPVLLR